MGVNTEFTHDKIFVYTSTKKNQNFPHDVYMGKKFDHFSWFFYFFFKEKSWRVWDRSLIIFCGFSIFFKEKSWRAWDRSLVIFRGFFYIFCEFWVYFFL